MQSRFDVSSCLTIWRDYLKFYVEKALKGQQTCLTTDT
jgi:hypothetical protein